MKHLGALITKWTLVLVAVLKPLGIWGAGAIALLDSSTIPVPMDLLIATYIWNDRRHAILYVLMGAAGSAIGGLLPFFLGRVGGELFLLKRIDRAKYERLRDRFEKQEFLALMIPSMLPPPTPWKMFVFAAGVFEMRIAAYLLAVAVGRCVRFGVLAVLTVRYGPEAVNLLQHAMRKHAAAVLTVVGFIVVALVIVAVRTSLVKRTAVAARI